VPSIAEPASQITVSDFNKRKRNKSQRKREKKQENLTIEILLVERKWKERGRRHNLQVQD
jgi:hypothetical protein